VQTLRTGGQGEPVSSRAACRTTGAGRLRSRCGVQTPTQSTTSSCCRTTIFKLPGVAHVRIAAIVMKEIIAEVVAAVGELRAELGGTGAGERERPRAAAKRARRKVGSSHGIWRTTMTTTRWKHALRKFLKMVGVARSASSSGGPRAR